MLHNYITIFSEYIDHGISFYITKNCLYFGSPLLQTCIFVLQNEFKLKLDSKNSFYFQAYIKIYQGEELPHPKSMLQVSIILYACLRLYDAKYSLFGTSLNKS